MSSKKETADPKRGSLKYAAAKIGCSLPTLYELMAAGKLRSYHIGRVHRVSDQAISDYIALLEREEGEHHVSCPTTLRTSEATREFESRWGRHLFKDLAANDTNRVTLV